ncbi:MAG: hypothetical protein S4CHLAM7_06350 [Chlamydiae bacterium]|nr:hypothetical protein [Chlamydiota bacterium]
MSHLILYDKHCSLCGVAIQFVLKKDKKRRFLFASLEGKTARSLCNMIHTAEAESVIFIEHFQTQKQRIYYQSKAVFRILWCLGGFWKLFGFKCFLPSWMFDWSYQLIAKRRHKICKVCSIKNPEIKRDSRFIS